MKALTAQMESLSPRPLLTCFLFLPQGFGAIVFHSPVYGAEENGSAVFLLFYIVVLVLVFKENR